MVTKILIFVAAFLLVSSEHHTEISSASLHTNSSPKQIIFKPFGEYYGETKNGTRYKKKYYFFEHFKSTWINAKIICKAFNLELATFETKDEADNFLKKTAAIKHFQDNNEAYVLVDGMTFMSELPMHFYWTNSGLKIPYNLTWAEGEPTNGYKDENCLSIGRANKNETLGFNDINCNENVAEFLCQQTMLIQ
ncbi:unnamed protein product [Chironomus riparius]|uniref:C-type lectin domain-containing protein n=1 Tax=Chironomus riparius TaxID=315576 RepID=A0A9N9WUE7_9DIPT|nr:unnamed protein product [Chironomus riparius]